MEELSRDLNRRERWPEKEIDKALLARYRQDESAFTAIYERFTPELLRFIESHLPGVLRRGGGHLARYLPGAMPETQRTATGHEAGRIPAHDCGTSPDGLHPGGDGGETGLPRNRLPRPLEERQRYTRARRPHEWPRC